MIRFLRKSVLRRYAEDTLRRLEVHLKKIAVAQEAHDKNCSGGCAFDLNLRGARAQITARQRVLQAEVAALTGGFPWVLVWSDSWHSLVHAMPFEDVVIELPSTPTSASGLFDLPSTPLPGVH